MTAEASACVERIRAAPTLAAVGAVAARVEAAYGLAQIAYFRPSPGGRAAAKEAEATPIGSRFVWGRGAGGCTLTSYDPAWVARYAAVGHHRVDPVLRAVVEHPAGVDWRAIDWTGPDAQAFWNEARAFGVAPQGFSAALFGPGGCEAVLTVTAHADDAAWDALLAAARGDLLLIAAALHERMRAVIGAPPPTGLDACARALLGHQIGRAHV